MNNLQRIPPIKWAMVHPRLAAWIVLSLGMIILLVIEARDIGLLPLQWVALLGACVLVAGVCVWIISWEDSDEEESSTSAGTPVMTQASVAPSSMSTAADNAKPEA